VHTDLDRACGCGYVRVVGLPAIEVHQIRPDLNDAVRALIVSGLAEHWGTADPALNRDLDDLTSAYASGKTLVACDRGLVVGTGTVVRRDDRSGELVRMSVAPSHRRSGVGRRLVEDLVAVARGWGMSRVVLETTADWTEVVRFYQRCGFAITHFVDGDFGRDAWFEMRLAPA
jgi:GNAT superfamily N-acetyltransferase